MAQIQRIDDERSAGALAELLNGDRRRRPVAIVTIPAGKSEPWIDVEELAREAGQLADVYLMPTGPFTWEFSRRMAEGTQVYGGAGRVYPVGHEWTTNLRKSPLVFAFDEAGGRRATQELISDTLRMASAAGLLHSTPVNTTRRVSGTVKMVIARRGLVDLGGRMPASIAEELTVEGVSIDRIVSVGQRIEGLYDAETNRIDIRAGLRTADQALAAYTADDVVLTKVQMVRNGKAELVLYPATSTAAVVVPIGRADVTSNPTDDLRTLMTVGEVIPARVVTPGPRWALTLTDVNDDDPIVVAPALLPDGPPWLVEESLEDLEPAAPLLPPSALAPIAPTVPDIAVPPQAPPRPSPAMFAKPGAHVGAAPSPGRPPVAAVSPSTTRLLLQIDGLKAEAGSLRREMGDFHTQLQASADERQQLRYLLDEAEHRANRAENDLKHAKARLRRAGAGKASPVRDDGVRFADREQGFRYLVLTSWATRTLPSEQAERPLPDFDIGPGFLDSVDALEGITTEKVADVAFEILTSLAAKLTSRDPHRMRTGLGGGDPVRSRADGAVCWRANLQTKTASARRIHYWVSPNGRIELAHVGIHDDYM